MKCKNYIFVLLVAFATLLSWWVIPSLVKKITDDSHSYPLVYYSSILKDLCVIDFRDGKDVFTDAKGNVYPRAEYDSLLPLLNSRVLMMNGVMPDTINGYAIDPKQLRMKQVSFRYRPSDMVAPQPQVGVLFEAMPKRGSLTMPGDFFRMDDERIAFIDAETNAVNEEKSERFTREMKKKGFAFPAQNFWGNPTTRKPYEEGYFCLDANGQLFQLKMVNDRPFVKNTHVSDSVGIRWFVMNEAMDKRHYGFVFGTKGEAGIIEENDGDYRFVRMDIRRIDPAKDELMILGNILYWTVNIQNNKGMDCYGLDRETLQCLSSYHMDAKRGLWKKTSEWLFPCYLTFTTPESGYVELYWNVGAWKAFLLNAVLALVALGLFYRRGRRCGILGALYVLCCGIPALVALLLFK